MKRPRLKRRPKHSKRNARIAALVLGGLSGYVVGKRFGISYARAYLIVREARTGIPDIERRRLAKRAGERDRGSPRARILAMLAHGFELSWLAIPLGILLGVATLLLTGPRWQFAGAPHRRVATGAIIATAACAGIAYAAAVESEAGDARTLSGLATLILLLALTAFMKAGAKQ